jgi:excisionase family DNA binding protein
MKDISITTVKLLTSQAFAEKLGIKISTVRSWLLARRIAKVRVGRRAIRIPESEVERIIHEGFVPAREERQ